MAAVPIASFGLLLPLKMDGALGSEDSYLLVFTPYFIAAAVAPCAIAVYSVRYLVNKAFMEMNVVCAYNGLWCFRDVTGLVMPDAGTRASNA